MTHEEALELVRILYFNLNEKNLRELNRTSKVYDKLDNYITQQEQLSKDVARYFELEKKYLLDDINSDDWQDYLSLKNRLSKVGKEE